MYPKYPSGRGTRLCGGVFPAKAGFWVLVLDFFGSAAAARDWQAAALLRDKTSSIASYAPSALTFSLPL